MYMYCTLKRSTTTCIYMLHDIHVHVNVHVYVHVHLYTITTIIILYEWWRYSIVCRENFLFH